MAGHLKIQLGKHDSSANKDIIAKETLLNLFHHGFDMMERFYDDNGEDNNWTRNSKRNPIKIVLFNDSINNEDVLALVTEVANWI